MHGNGESLLAKGTNELNVTGTAGKGPQQPADGMQSSALASSSAQDGGEAECVASEGGASASADPAQQPVLVCSCATPFFRTSYCLNTPEAQQSPRHEYGSFLPDLGWALEILPCAEQVFEVEDPEGPLDTPSEDIGQHFGRLHLRTAAELGLPAQQLSQLAAAQCDTPQPTLEEDLELWKRHVGIQQGSGDDSFANQHPGAVCECCRADKEILLFNHLHFHVEALMGISYCDAQVMRRQTVFQLWPHMCGSA